MAGQTLTREFKRDGVALIKEHGMEYARAIQDFNMATLRRAVGPRGLRAARSIPFSIGQ
ncbi:MAG: hypothetical protein P4L87_26385 [Formivibrio sp.]|nr:hypothetical protein [Formivibrio sp.]